MSQQPIQSDSAPITRKRRHRPSLNCAECRRLKVKCDRQVPCGYCVRSGCPQLCPDGTRMIAKRRKNETELGDYITTLQNTLNQHGVPVPVISEGADSALEQPKGPSSSTMDSQDSTTNHMTADLGSSSLPAQNTRHTPNVHYALPSPLDVPLQASDPSSAILSPFEAGNFVPSDTSAAVHDSPSSGLLVVNLNKRGQSKYLGPTAASEWLRDEERNPHVDRTPAASRAASPTITGASQVSFPFSAAHTVSTASLLQELPDKKEALALTTSYQRYFGWSYDIAPSKVVDSFVNDAYTAKESAASSGQVTIDLQDLAVVYAVFAMGTVSGLEMTAEDPVGDEYIEHARAALVKGRFITEPSLSGVRTLSIMAHYHMETDRGRNGDWAWPLWGLAMRSAQSMGLHRDGQLWNLPEAVVNDRRKCFWEVYSAETFIGNNFSRPPSLRPEFVDTKYPTEAPDEDLEFSRTKWNLVPLSQKTLVFSLRLDHPPFSEAMSLYHQLTQYQRDIPFRLRCRSALSVSPSLYPDPLDAIADSPPFQKRDIGLSLRQFVLAVLVSETVIALLRPYFLKAIIESPLDPSLSQYGPAFLAVTERCNVLIQTASFVYSNIRLVSARHWWFWYHAYGSAICMATLALRCPKSTFASTAIPLMDQVITLFHGLNHVRPSSRTQRNLQWLIGVRDRVNRAVSQEETSSPEMVPRPVAGAGAAEDSDLAYLGWRTRVIERFGQTQTAASITLPAKDAMRADQGQGNAIAPTADSSFTLPNAADFSSFSLSTSNLGLPNFNMNPNMNMGTEGTASAEALLDFWQPLVQGQHIGTDINANVGDWWDQLFKFPDEGVGNLPRM